MELMEEILFNLPLRAGCLGMSLEQYEVEVDRRRLTLFEEKESPIHMVGGR